MELFGLLSCKTCSRSVRHSFTPQHKSTWLWLPRNPHGRGLRHRPGLCHKFVDQVENTVPATVAAISRASANTDRYPLAPAGQGRQRHPESRATAATGNRIAKQTSITNRQDQTSSAFSPWVRAVRLFKTSSSEVLHPLDALPKTPWAQAAFPATRRCAT